MIRGVQKPALLLIEPRERIHHLRIEMVSFVPLKNRECIT